MAENNRLKAKNRELEDQLAQMQSELMRFRGSFATKRVLVSSTALLSVAVIGLVSFPAVPLPQIHVSLIKSIFKLSKIFNSRVNKK